MSPFRVDGDTLLWRSGHELLRIRPWGPGSLRVQSGLHALRDDLPGALLDAPAPAPAQAVVEPGGARITNGLLTAAVSEAGLVSFSRTDDGTELLAEQPAHFWWPGPRHFLSAGNGYQRLEQRFRAYPGERLYGLGQRMHGRFDQKGMVLELEQRNGEITIPFALSSRGYGLLWNSPAVGRVELAENGTRWVADGARQIDYWITADPDPAAIVSRYAEATGRPPMLPEWATGFWQSKLRYRTQDELLAVAREHRERGLPLSVIVADFFHWTRLGDWRFDPAEWPDPAAMVRELDEMGVRLMVSIWPSVNPTSENHPAMAERGLLVGTESGVEFHAGWVDKGNDAEIPVAFYDATSPEARRFVWETVRRNYYDLGIRVWWLDACEPEIRPGHPANLRFHTGPGLEVFNSYPAEHARGFYEGMREAGEDEIVLLCRSAWAGSQRWGAAVWSGDIPATFESLAAQVPAGLNMAVSGIPWWTTDIGGFHGGDPDDPLYRELIVRWFQFAAFCPLFRLHGNRDPRTPLGAAMTGGPNEVWSYGADAYALITDILHLRERLRPYLAEQMRTAHERGLPPMRPLFLEFPDDPRSWEVEDQFLLGPDLLVAPVTSPGATERTVYLPKGSTWTDAWTGTELEPGAEHQVAAPLSRIPVFLRDGARVPIAQ
ncbi:glycoside hydrolase family 31 protein [Allonocardiopsis opalescens]|uniref:Alpha-D-xyloside xylohydrolase n=1 Tax=Allonocardiopsis opalescens TaxID=1144618 RepID=A0A2T0PX32_9ACTN|nr:glycoside hydrolase family 31 protein [Allonocardiopsis opalescens]PRX96097.1 alpha-D-xyloside xylohydrolase [Allonocardiopsis opalescens]